ncbi:hypothetical protein HPP92_025686 [Vanilla planifolia]|uniref:Uncharacterized protein n=1 Tax=Vanilla planifolia TaxID=51239 RepID=A0A835PMS2_VANPL|nr:hypothetical protein HPP92_025686 [Vanilla planifolia]
MRRLRIVMPITHHCLLPKSSYHGKGPNFSRKHQCLSLFSFISSMRQLLQIHSYLLTSGLLSSDKFLVSEILRFCSLHPSGDLSHARALLFRSSSAMSSSWNHVIRGLCLNSLWEEAVAVFLEMRRQGVTPNELTYPFVIKSCAEFSGVCIGRQVHADAIKNAVASVVYVGNTLMHLYGTCGENTDARRVFDGMSHRTVVSWNTILSVYVYSLMIGKALEILDEMMNNGCECDQTTYIALLSASALMGSLALGRWVHCQIIYRREEVNLKLGTALVNMYAKCGSLDLAVVMFERMPEKNVWTWSAMILAFAQNGSAQASLDFFEQMNSSIKPNSVTFLGVLCACSHAGLIDTGFGFFHDMIHLHHIQPEMSHYSAMVDVLGRNGLLVEAYGFIKSMPVEPDAVVWRTLLGACQLHRTRDVRGIGETAKRNLLTLEPSRCGNYVMVANIYSDNGSWKEAAKVRSIMKEEGMKKIAGESCIEVSGSNHRFFSGDDSCTNSDRIFQLLDWLHFHMKKHDVVGSKDYVQSQ